MVIGFYDYFTPNISQQEMLRRESPLNYYKTNISLTFVSRLHFKQKWSSILNVSAGERVHMRAEPHARAAEGL